MINQEVMRNPNSRGRLLRFGWGDPASRPVRVANDKVERRRKPSLSGATREMANDDGLGSYDRYKCPIF